MCTMNKKNKIKGGTTSEQHNGKERNKKIKSGEEKYEW